MDDVEVKGKI